MSYRERLDNATEAVIAEEVARQRKRFKPGDADQAVLLIRADRQRRAERARRQENAA